jgi:hypothetical protein
MYEGGNAGQAHPWPPQSEGAMVMVLGHRPLGQPQVQLGAGHIPKGLVAWVLCMHVLHLLE